MRRLVASALVLAAVTAAPAAAAPTATAPAGSPPAQLKVGDATSGTFAFGTSRAAVTRTILVTITGAHSADNPVAVVSTDLSAGDHLIPASAVSATATLSPQTADLLVLSVTVTPGEAHRGDYHGTLYVRSKDVASATIPIEARLAGRTHSIWLALLWLLLGIAVAAAAKWLVEVALKLRQLGRRVADLELQVDRLGDWAPPGLRADLVRARGLVELGQQEQASSLLDQLAQGLQSVTTQTLALAQAAARLDEAGKQVAALAPDLRGQLEPVASTLARRLQEARDGLWVGSAPGQGSGSTEVVSAVHTFQVFVVLLAHSGDDALVARLTALIPLLQDSSDFSEIQKTLDELAKPAPPRRAGLVEWLVDAVSPSRRGGLPGGAIAAPGLDLGTASSRGVRLRGLSRSIRAAAIAHAGFLSGAIVAIVIAAIGLKSLYSDADTYGSWRDWLALAAWGFGAQLSGVTLTSLGGKFKPTSGL